MMSPLETVQLLQRQPEQIFAPGDVIFEEEKPGYIMYGIVEGEVEIHVNGKLLETLKAGDVFGEGSLIHEDSLRLSTAIAKTECKLATLDREHFLFAVQQTPMFAIQVMRSYSDRFRRIKDMI